MTIDRYFIVGKAAALATAYPSGTGRIVNITTNYAKIEVIVGG